MLVLGQCPSDSFLLFVFSPPSPKGSDSCSLCFSNFLVTWRAWVWPVKGPSRILEDGRKGKSRFTLSFCLVSIFTHVSSSHKADLPWFHLLLCGPGSTGPFPFPLQPGLPQLVVANLCLGDLCLASPKLHVSHSLFQILTFSIKHLFS